MTAAILTAARLCLDTPFRHQGRLPGVALDCAGLVLAVARAVGVEAVDFPGYGRQPFQGQLEAALAAQPGLELVAIADRQPGDVLLMRIARDPQHLAILGEGTLIHAWADAGQVCEHRLDERWLARIVAVYRFKVAP